MMLPFKVRPLALLAAIALGLAAQWAGAEAAPLKKAYVAGGCFWCVEADFEKVEGVTEAVSGFTGGDVENPTYNQVTKGGTGHYEAVEISFDPSVVSRSQLLSMFLRSIDPTDAGGQFCDRGDSYRTAIFVSNQEERSLAEQKVEAAENKLGKEIVTPVLNKEAFYPADSYHQDYYKGRKLVLTRFGPKSQASAYKAYRAACGRDDRVRDLWGEAAPFVGN